MMLPRKQPSSTNIRQLAETEGTEIFTAEKGEKEVGLTGTIVAMNDDEKVKKS